MKSVCIDKYGDSSVVSLKDIDEPLINENLVRVKVYASSINHLDLWVRSGITGIKHAFPFTLGSDASGVVEEIGSKVKLLNIGDRVVVFPGFHKELGKIKDEHYSKSYKIIGEHINGVQSEYINLPEINLYKIDNTLTFPDASSIPLVFMTAYEMLVVKGKIKEGDNILVYGANSGVGAACIQIAKYFNANIYTTVTNSKKAYFAEKLGADKIFYLNNNFYNDVKTNIGTNRFDIIIDHIGEETWDISMKLLDIGGKLIFCGATSGYKVNIDLRHLFIKQQLIIGSTMSSYSSFKDMMILISKIKYKSIVDKIFPFKDVASAHKYIDERKNIGKVILVP